MNSGLGCVICSGPQDITEGLGSHLQAKACLPGIPSLGVLSYHAKKFDCHFGETS